MKILIINNNTRHLFYLKKALAAHELEVVIYEPGVSLNCRDKDLVILSGGGGEGNEINDTVNKGKLWYDDEMEFILRCKKPIVGICMGFEVIARAFGSQVKEMDDLIRGYKNLTTTPAGEKAFLRRNIKQYEAHKWYVPSIDDNQFEVWAESPSGIEAIRHKTLPIIATQFHPEKDGTLALSHIIAQVC
jgi:anthranilate/para-aminobenzoate synthase component II